MNPRRTTFALAAALAAVPAATSPARADGSLADQSAAVVAPAAAQGRAPIRVAGARRLVGAIAIDGALDEPGWAAAPVQADFSQRQPRDGAAPTFATEFRVLYGDDALYVGIRAFDDQPGQIRGLLARRDAETASDWLFLGIDSYRDKRTGFVFGLNPAGVQRDFLVFDDVGTDPSWDAVWEGDARIDADGWTAEFRIPFGQLRFAAADEQVWGLQVQRELRRLGETDIWAPWPKADRQIVSRFGEVRGLLGIAPARRLELLPYATLGGALSHAEPGDPFDGGADAIYGAGGDFRLGLGSSFTVSGTINPDFGQVEADPSQVNLGAGELFFAEKRPFFLEGVDIFRFAAGQGDDNSESLFYSRRIGAAPHGDGADYGAFAAQPDVTTIYGAAKLSGKTATGWSIGLLEAVTGQERARVAPAGAGPIDEVVVEPTASYTVARVRKDLREGRTTIGGVVTGVHRAVDGTEVAWLHDRAYAGGLEASHRFGDDTFLLEATLMGSSVHGSREALLATQTSPVHYFQRPGDDHVELDPTRTRLAGVAGNLFLGKTIGDLRYATGLEARSPGFEVNDLGYQQHSDYLVNWYWAQLRDDAAGDRVRDWQVNVDESHVFDTSGRLLNLGGNLNASASLMNQWGGSAGLAAEYSRNDPGGLRGGPTLRRDTHYRTWWSLWSDDRRALRGSLDGFAFVAPASDSHGVGLTPRLTWQLASNAELSLAPNLAVTVDDNQYVDTVVDAGGAPHYLMARIRQITTGLTLRGSVALSPTLSLELYAQPFVATGRYLEYKEAIAPQAAAYDDRYHVLSPAELATRDGGELGVDRDGDGTDDYRFAPADFSFRQLRSNLVVRWEYRPGSTLFVIWSHDRTSEATDGRYRLGDELGGLADAPGEHLVMAKLSYWFGL